MSERKKPAITEELEGPSRLAVDQAFFDQPPFDKLLGRDDLLPSEAIKDQTEEGVRIARIRVIQAAVAMQEYDRYVVVGASVENRFIKTLLPNKVTSLQLFAKNAKKILEEYPFLVDYLSQHLEYHLFDLDGNRRETPYLPTTLPSYIGYAVTKLRLQRNARWVGLEEELPRGYSDAEDVREAVRGKTADPKVKLLRLLESEAFN